MLTSISNTCRLCTSLGLRTRRTDLWHNQRFSRWLASVNRQRTHLDADNTFPSRVFSGIQPSGVPHLGNYFGAIQRWKALQDSSHDCIFSVVDLHSITKPHYDANMLRLNIELMTASLLACGIDPEKSILFLQSQVPEHAELSWILGCLHSTARLQHLPQLKDKTAGMKETPLGLYLYPVLQCADVMLYKATKVPVGKDQLPHIYFVQDTAEAFNKRFGPIFPRPEPLLVSGEAGRLRHLRDPTKKMSKSSDDPRSYVALDDPPNVVRDKIKKALTDCTSQVTYEPEPRPAVANLVILHSLLTGLSPEEVCREAEGLDTGKFKLAIADAAVAFLAPIQERMQEYLLDRARLWHILEEGSRRARKIAIRTMEEVHRASGMVPLGIRNGAETVAKARGR
uniref:tryptophan--tRNA ligase n=1 Tax=Amblyomma maculatum TaxID=34609 RepID=G3MQF1_AMBMU